MTSPPILTRPMVMLMTVTVGAFTCFWLLFSVSPLYAARTGAGEVGAGLATGVTMAGTVALEFAVPWLIRKIGYRAVLALAAVLLGVPALALPYSTSLPVILAICLVRGGGLGIGVVAGTALVAALTPPSRRGEGLGLYGVAVGVPSVAGLPVGLWLTDQIGFAPVFLLAAAAALVVLPAALGIPSRAGTAAAEKGNGTSLEGLIRPMVIFSATTFAVGAIVTFVPLAGSTLAIASAALLAQSVATPLSRWWAGWYGDRRGASKLLIPGVLISGLGMAAVALPSPILLIAGAAVFGVGFGIVQNVTLTLMFARVTEEGFGKTSVLWNLAFDAGMGAGGAGLGLVIGVLGYPLAFALTAAMILASLVIARRDVTAHSLVAC